MKTMNLKWLTLAGLMAGGAFSSAKAALQFTNVTAALSASLPGLTTNKLLAAAYNGSSNFLAVGENEAWVTATFQSNQFLIAPTNWKNGVMSSPGVVLQAVAASPDLFVASGAQNQVWTSSDGKTWTTNGQVSKVSTDTARTMGLAWNSAASLFVAALAAPEIDFAGGPVLTN